MEADKEIQALADTIEWLAEQQRGDKVAAMNSITIKVSLILVEKMRRIREEERSFRS